MFSNGSLVSRLESGMSGMWRGVACGNCRSGQTVHERMGALCEEF